MPNFTGQLRSNEIFGALFNMIISQQVFADNIKGTQSSLVDSARVDGTLYGDTKLYYATDVLKSNEWGNDSEASNLLALSRPQAPKQQAIYIDKFRQIALTVDNYLSKRAWSTENAFSQFTSVMLGWIGVTKRIYDATLYNSYIGTATSAATRNTITVALSGITDTGEAKNRLEAQTIAQSIANLFVDMKDVSRDFNDYKFLRSYDLNGLKVVWNSSFVNKINTIDLPTIFHKDGLIEKFAQEVLPSRYFGNVNASSGTTGSTNTTIRSLIEKDFNSVAMSDASYNPSKHVFPGDLLPNSTAYGASETYTVNTKIICKIMASDSVPYMSAFEVGTSFFNPKSLTENHYLTFGHNTLEYLKAKPLIKVISD